MKNPLYPKDLYIIAAGKGSRMKANVPKALVPITDDEPCLTTTLKQIRDKFEHVFIIANTQAQLQWRQYIISLHRDFPVLAKNVHLIQINSGLGDGHAVLQGLTSAELLTLDTSDSTVLRGKTLSSDVVIAWGDVFFQHAEIIDELFDQAPMGSGLLPAVREQNPYVSLLVDDKLQCISADFSKYGENHPTGFHDQSVFLFDKSRLMGSLRDLHNAFWKGGRYITPGGELSLLYAFHHLYNIGDPAHVYETDYPTLSFNTVEEVAAIQQEITTRWKARQSSL